MKPIMFPPNWCDRSWLRKFCETTPVFGDVAMLKKSIRHQIHSRDGRWIEEWNTYSLGRDIIVKNILMPFEMYWGSYKIIPNDSVDALLLPDKDFDIMNEVSKRCGMRIPYKYFDDFLHDGIPGCLELCDESIYKSDMAFLVNKIAIFIGCRSGKKKLEYIELYK